MRKTDFRADSVVRILWIILFLALCLIPSVGMLFAGETKPSANEILSSRPVLVKRDGSINTAVLDDVTDYIADRFAFRKKLVTAWAQLNASLFHSSAERQVILGSDGWLYFEPTLNDYMGRSMSEDQLDRAAAYLAALQQKAESRGARFLFTVAPNKNSLYGEHMPFYIPADHASSNLERLKPYLMRYGVNYLDLFDVLSARDEELYYRGDTHWTDRGAALAADALLAALDKPSAYFAGPFAAGEPHMGDLYEMLFPTGREREESAYYVPGFSYELSGDPNGGNALRISSACSGRDGSLLCWRDSFGISLYPYLSDSFESAVFLRSSSYDLAEIEKTGADTVLIEIAERNLPQLSDAGKK